ncbi:MAG: hypothetical protein M1826_004674 [Phylliscum demangeonii]|nr:MAG: hypothetical protein M1826_004674 [Phylliscum demangeonii]
MCRRLKFAVVFVPWCLAVFATAVRITRNGRPLPDQHPLDEYGYGQTFDLDRDQAASWIRKMASTKSYDNMTSAFHHDANSIAEWDGKWEKEQVLIFAHDTLRSSFPL